jgi:hypothetical protein
MHPPVGAQPGEAVLGIPELFSTLTDAVWAEAGAARTREPARGIGSVRRDLQRLYLNTLVRMVVNPAPGTPEDARAVARVTLTDLGGRLDRALAGNRTGLDGYTKAHLVDSRERIAQALAAPMLQVTSTLR